MNIAIFGVGYVGSVSAACLAEQGNTVVLVDVDPAKVDSINGGRAPIAEPGLADLIAVNVARGRLKATQDVAAAVGETELCLICVGTPSDAGGDLDLTFVRQVCGQIGAALANLVWLLNPNCIILGGGMAQAGELIFEPIRKSLASRTMPEYVKDLLIIPAELGSDAGVIGAAALAVDSQT